MWRAPKACAPGSGPHAIEQPLTVRAGPGRRLHRRELRVSARLNVGERILLAHSRDAGRSKDSPVPRRYRVGQSGDQPHGGVLRGFPVQPKLLGGLFIGLEPNTEVKFVTQWTFARPPSQEQACCCFFLAAITFGHPRLSSVNSNFGSGARIRTVNLAVNSRLLYR